MAFRKAFIIFMNISKTSNSNELMATEVCFQVTLKNFRQAVQLSDPHDPTEEAVISIPSHFLVNICEELTWLYPTWGSALAWGCRELSDFPGKFKHLELPRHPPHSSQDRGWSLAMDPLSRTRDHSVSLTPPALGREQGTGKNSPSLQRCSWKEICHRSLFVPEINLPLRQVNLRQNL